MYCRREAWRTCTWSGAGRRVRRSRARSCRRPRSPRCTGSPLSCGHLRHHLRRSAPAPRPSARPAAQHKLHSSLALVLFTGLFTCFRQLYGEPDYPTPLFNWHILVSEKNEANKPMRWALIMRKSMPQNALGWGIESDLNQSPQLRSH